MRQARLAKPGKRTQRQEAGNVVRLNQETEWVQRLVLTETSAEAYQGGLGRQSCGQRANQVLVCIPLIR